MSKKILLEKKSDVSHVITQSQQATQNATFVSRAVPFISQSDHTEVRAKLQVARSGNLGLCALGVLTSLALGCVASCTVDRFDPWLPDE